MTTFNQGETLRRIDLNLQEIFDSGGNFIGFVNPVSGGDDFRPVRFTHDGTALIGVGGGMINLSGVLTPGQIVSRQMTGATFTQNTPLYSWQLTQAMAADFDAVRLVFHNNKNSTFTIDSAIVGASDSASFLSDPHGTGNSGAAAWTAVTFAGSASGTIPANTAATPLTIPNFYYSDWIPVESLARTDVVGALPIVMARVYIAGASMPSSGNGLSTAGWNTPANVGGMLLKTAYASGDFVSSNQAGFAGSAADPAQSPIVGIQGLARGKVVDVAFFGDSIIRGYKATVDGYGWPVRACNAVSTLAKPVSCLDLGWNSQSTTLSLARFKAMIAGGYLPRVAVYCPYTRNDGVTDTTGLQGQRYRMNDFLNTCYTNKILPVLVTGISESGLAAGKETLRVAINAYAAASGADIIDASSVISPGGVYSAALMDADGIHPNDAGYAAIATVAATVLTRYVR